MTNLQQLIEHARKAKPALNYTSSGTGSFGHLSMEQLKDLGGFDMQHVPYRGSAPAVTDLIGGQIAVMFADVVAALPHIQAGKLRAIAVSSQKAKQLLPNVKSVAEQGFPGFDADTWGGLIAPLNTPPAVVQRLNQELKLILAEPELQKKMLAAGAIATYQDGAAMKARLNADFTRWSKIAKDKNIDLNNLAGSGTGAGGRITKDDILNFVQTHGAGASAPAQQRAPQQHIRSKRHLQHDRAGPLRERRWC